MTVTWQAVALAALNVVQVVLLAWVGAWARKSNRLLNGRQESLQRAVEALQPQRDDSPGTGTRSGPSGTTLEASTTGRAAGGG